MTDTLAAVPADIRNAAHAEIVESLTWDQRYADGRNNAKKVEYICGVLNYDKDAFDLDLPFPLDDWMVSDDTSLACAGLYLSDLRYQFYGKLIGPTPTAHPLFEQYSLAEFYQQVFNKIVRQRQEAVLIKDHRVLN